MSTVSGAGERLPGVMRTVVKLGFSCVLLGGCSATSERFQSLDFSSGYQSAAPAPTQTSRVALNTPQYTAPQTPRYAASSYSQNASGYHAGASNYSYPAQQASYQPQPAGGYQLASANQGQSGSYLQASRVDIPPPQQAAPAQSGTRTADGYGRYNQPPVADGVYTGPRVYTPYNGPADYVPPSAPPPAEGRYDAPPPPPPLPYRQSESEAPAYVPPPPRYRDEPPPPPRNYDRAPERYGSYGRPDRGNGKVVTVQPGESLYSLAIRHGVTVEMIVRANNLSNRYYVKPGTELVIPLAGPARYSQGQGDAKAQPAGCTGAGCYTVKKGETIATIARAHRVTEAQLLAANNLPDARSLKAGQAITIPGAEAPRQAVASAAPLARAPANERQELAPAPVEPQPQATMKAPELKPAPEVKMAAAKPAEPQCDAALGNPAPRMGKNFRKPVEGAIIGPFGPQRDGSVNEGVTYSVPKGTQIKAAENGVVAYVGDELPGFGNLVLIRHAEEYVTAYAHADEILVKKCDVVKRGQVVAKAGATGDASQPQLHFEIRKNAKPVDPGPLLGS
jgi:murein DD-endopeptidase MepM/ murein hydrolase activator NlpD